MRFVSTSDYKADSVLAQSSYLNRPNAYGFSRKDFKARSLDQSRKVARRVLGYLIPELSVSQFNESVRIFDAYLASFKNTPKSTHRIESLILASAYISVRRDRGYLSLLDVSSRLKSKNYRSLASLIRRICIRLRIKSLPSISIEESLDFVYSKVEKFLREEAAAPKTAERPTQETVVLQSPLDETSEARNLMLESLLGDAPGQPEPTNQKHAGNYCIKNSKQYLKVKSKEKANSESLLKAKNFALLILKTVLDNDQTKVNFQDDVLDPFWFSNGACSTPTISASLYFSFKLYCRKISLNDLLEATGVSKSSITKARKLLSHKLRQVSQRIFPGWLSPDLLESNSELPPSIMESLTNLIHSQGLCSNS
ncbi:hypothetical protein OJ253_2881 [Cryptosporidium canis]|uniref:Uncharacterized protein n=1 Tax=Cryptosporidium canis TaxID=195482 RepID=A0A9D5DGU0_9CRYT|nr:hypothetical protein OJ253_2881 [Cryptosporidium canis]